MFVGICQMDILVQSSQSLKEKRFVLKSIKDRVKRKFNVAIAEVDHLDKWQLAGLGMATVTNEYRIVQKTFDEIIKLIEASGDAEVVSHTIDIQ